ncbi:hypothetical protein [Staphylococcus sp. EZ-P03]|uniref:hypothetical protein n=1 Tax=Staphylococcus sp. EZ-P03 TaxID=2282739 RepID=UPI000DF77B97|nr:hypothetical protein [Staphylococcus sp. EZ-P03]
MKKLLVLFLSFIIILAACGKKEVSLDDIVKEFQNEKLSTHDLKTMTKDDFGPAPMASEKAKIFTVEGNRHARIFKFKNDSDLKTTKKYYDELGKASALFYSHTYAKGNYLIQMNGDVKEETFEKYKKVMEKLIEE